MLNKIIAVAILSAIPGAAFATSGTYITRDPAGGTIRYPHDGSALRHSNGRAEFRVTAIKRDPAGGTIVERTPVVAPQTRR